MWKAAFVLILLFVAGHFAVRYIRTNPLDPLIEGNEVVVGTNDYDVRFARDGRVEGTYLVTAAERTDRSNEPSNVALAVLHFAQARDYLHAYPDFRRYGPVAGRQLESASNTVALIAANRLVYNDLYGLIGLVEKRIGDRGERVCITLEGESLRVVQASSREGGHDGTTAYVNREGARQVVFVHELEIDDCSALAEAR